MSEQRPNKSRKNYDFTLPYQEYLTSDLSFRDLSYKYNIPESTLHGRAAKEKWFEQRNQIRADAREKAMSEYRKQLMTELEEINRADLSMSKGFRNLIAQKLLNMTKKPEKTPVQDMASLGRLHKDVQQVSRLALGATTENTKSETVLTRKSANEMTTDELLDTFASL